MKPFPPCERCGQADEPTAYQSKDTGIGGQLCQVCLERMVGVLNAFRWGQQMVGGGNCACGGVLRKHGEPSPWQEIALRAWEEGEE